MLLLAAVVGAVTGLAVAGFVQLTDAVVFDAVLDAPGWVRVAAPGLGLVIAVLAVRFLTDDHGTGTADEYIGAYHEGRGVVLRRVPGRLLAGLATIGLGGALGLEGPSIYLGAAVGTAAQHRLSRLFTSDETTLLLVAGAAAGVAAVFRAPATGVVFALEVPYTDDIARRALLPALVASATSYVTFAALIDTKPLFTVLGTSTGFSLRDLGGALAVGALCGVLARAFSMLVLAAKELAHASIVWRLATGAAVLGVLSVVSSHLYGSPLSLGPGYQVFSWLADPRRTLPLIAVLFAIRLVAVVVVLGAGGTGGLFIPLALLGALAGSFVAHLTGDATTLFPVVGLAAFLGAGYRTPLASVMFVAETTGRAAFVVPALLATAVSQLLMGRASVSSQQQVGRAELDAAPE